MTYQKSAFKRYNIIDRCLNNPRKEYWTREELLEKLRAADLSVSSRTLDNDIADMKSEKYLPFGNAPIEWDHQFRAYHYTAPFRIGIQLNDEEIHALKVAVSTLTQFRDVGYFNQFSATVDKVVRIVTQATESNKIQHQSHILFEKVPFLQGYEFLDPLILAIEEKRSMLLTYQKFEYESPQTFLFHPYFVKEYRNRWYVVGYNTERQGLRTYGLDRIKMISPSNEPFIENSLAIPESYFKDCIGVDLKNKKVQKVVLSFDPSQGNYIRTQHLHRSQQILVDNKEEFRISLHVMLNQELIMILLSYGAKVTVLQPPELVREIALTANAVAAIYHKK